jgi:hypothetical protein
MQLLSFRSSEAPVRFRLGAVFRSCCAQDRYLWLPADLVGSVARLSGMNWRQGDSKSRHSNLSSFSPSRFPKRAFPQFVFSPLIKELTLVATEG